MITSTLENCLFGGTLKVGFTPMSSAENKMKIIPKLSKSSFGENLE
jgi:hypothetical protein